MTSIYVSISNVAVSFPNIILWSNEIQVCCQVYFNSSKKNSRQFMLLKAEGRKGLTLLNFLCVKCQTMQSVCSVYIPESLKINKLN